jgi:hypothetical protein
MLFHLRVETGTVYTGAPDELSSSTNRNIASTPSSCCGATAPDTPALYIFLINCNGGQEPRTSVSVFERREKQHDPHDETIVRRRYGFTGVL